MDKSKRVGQAPAKANVQEKRQRLNVLDSDNAGVRDVEDVIEEPGIEERPLETPAEDVPVLTQEDKIQFATGVIRSITWKPEGTCISLVGFLIALEKQVSETIPTIIGRRRKPIKVLLDVQLEYSKLKGETLEPVVKAVLRTTAKTVTGGDDVVAFTKTQCDVLWERHQNFIREKSGLVVHAVYWGKMTIGEVDVLRGASYVELPAQIRNKRAVINIKNKDQRCFGYAVLACKYSARAYQKFVNEPRQYDRYFEAEHLNDISYPVDICQLAQVEEQLKIPVNVYSFMDDKGEGMYVVYLSKLNRKEAINLLYWQGHYSWIKDFPRLMSGVTEHQGRKHFCMQCLGHFSTRLVLEKHEKYCTGDTCEQVVTMMPEGSVLKFRNVRYQQRSPFVVFADFECVTSKIETNAHVDPVGVLDVQPSTAYQAHKPCAVGLKLVSVLNETEGEYESFFGEDCCERFLERLVAIENQCMQVLFDPKRLNMSAEDEERFKMARECYVCCKMFGLKETKVRDHDHVTGQFRGAAHQRCNLLLRKQYKINVIFHNFRGYDSHLIVTALGKNDKERPLKVIGQGMEKYLTLSYGDHLVFKDSLQFMQESLEGLVECLKRGGSEKFIRMRKEFGDGSDGKLQTLLRKGVYPYDYMDTMDRFKETRLPPIEEFRSRLRQEDCGEEDYAHAQRVWTMFECKTMKDYHDLYLKTDVLLLSDVFEAFRDVCMTNYQLDPAHYVSAPHLSWDAMLKMTECELELLSDPEMYRMLESGLRGGVAMVSKRYAKANNPRIGGDQYDPSKPEKHIVYWDANNLYGWAMSQSLPRSGFRWMSESEIAEIDWMSLKKSSEKGYVLECDLEYPRELHDDHNDYPLAPERMRVGGTMLSRKQKDLLAAYKEREVEKLTKSYSTKLVPNLYNKTRYALHYRNLKFYLKHGMVLRKVHRVLEFNQSEFMRVYIELNQNLRAAAKTDFEKNFYKLMNNSCYGKTCENQRKRSDVRLLTSEAQAQKLLSLPHLLRFQVFNANVAAAELMKPRCIISKPFYIGFTVLELSKLHMYRFHYDFVKKHWPGEKSDLLFTDTDSLMYEIEDPNLFNRVWEHRDRFDLSEYPKDFFNDNTNKKVIGKFKDETNSVPVVEFVGLRPKMYSFTTKKDESNSVSEKSRAKGIQRAALKQLHHEDYLRQLKTPQANSIVNRRIGAHLHRIYTYEFEKRGLCSFDDKRYILEDGVRTLAYGHHRVRSIQQQQHEHYVRASAETSAVQSFTSARASGELENFVPEEEDDEEVVHVLNQPRPIRPGLDPRQTAWELRKLHLAATFEEPDPPDNFLEFLPFVV